MPISKKSISSPNSNESAKTIIQKLAAYSTPVRRTHIRELEKGDPDLAALLWLTFKEPPFSTGDVVELGQYHYDLIESLGVGGFGEVWKVARHSKLLAPGMRPSGLRNSRPFAIKFGSPDRIFGKDGSHYRRMFEKEIAILEKLSSQDVGVPTLYESGSHSVFGWDKRVPFFVMEHIQGNDITQVLQGRSVRDQVSCFVNVCEKVQGIHNAEHSHLDLKPANILVIEKNGKLTPKILDFGLARESESLLRKERLEFLPGTLAYIAPEQVVQWVPDPRCDVYSLGIILYEILTHHLPYEVGNGGQEALLKAVIHTGPKKLGETHAKFDLPPKLVDDLETILGASMQREPKDRFRNAGEFGTALKRWLKKVTEGSSVSRSKRRIPHSATIYSNTFKSIDVKDGASATIIGINIDR